MLPARPPPGRRCQQPRTGQEGAGAPSHPPVSAASWMLWPLFSPEPAGSLPARTGSARLAQGQAALYQPRNAAWGGDVEMRCVGRASRRGWGVAAVPVLQAGVGRGDAGAPHAVLIPTVQKLSQDCAHREAPGTSHVPPLSPSSSQGKLGALGSPAQPS